MINIAGPNRVFLRQVNKLHLICLLTVAWLIFITVKSGKCTYQQMHNLSVGVLALQKDSWQSLDNLLQLLIRTANTKRDIMMKYSFLIIKHLVKFFYKKIPNVYKKYNS